MKLSKIDVIQLHIVSEHIMRPQGAGVTNKWATNGPQKSRSYLRGLLKETNISNNNLVTGKSSENFVTYVTVVYVIQKN